jgi:tRNA threonylcarbamoyladenosine biosynthesis protein TsaB
VKILCIDTSTSAGSIALSEGERLIGELNVDSTQTHSVRLLLGIDTLLKSVGLSLGDLDAFAAISGPGSFTGIRIGLTVVKGLADSVSKPIASITAFEAWVEKFPGQNGVVIPVIDARRGEVYAAIYRRSEEGLDLVAPGIVEKAGTFFKGIVHPRASFIGCGARQYDSLILSGEQPGWSVLSSDGFLGRPMARLAYRKAKAGILVSAGEVKACYLRRSDAELNWKAR